MTENLRNAFRQQKKKELQADKQKGIETFPLMRICDPLTGENSLTSLRFEDNLRVQN